MKKGIVIISSLVLLASQSAIAGNRPGAFTFTPGAGYVWFDDKRPFDSAGIGDLAIAYNFTNTWALEAMWGTTNPNMTFESGFGKRHTHGNLYTVDGIYRFGRFYQVIEPYVEAGMGAFSFTRNGNDANTQANANAGLGTQIFIDKSIAFRGEVRDLYTFVGGKNDVMLNFGVSFLFGGETPQMPVYKDQMMKGEG